MEKLTKRQQVIFDFIKKEIKSKGIPPSIREIGKVAGLSSTSSVHLNLLNLEKKGYILRSKSKTRHIEVLEYNFYGEAENKETCNVPIIGTVSAGEPMLAAENVEDYFPIPVQYLKNKEAFMLKIKGDSMIDAGIFHNDFVLVSRDLNVIDRDIVIVIIDEDTATCKRYFYENGKIRLQPENKVYEPIIVDEKNVRIIGKVIGLFRTIG